jgi:hypothetical protein
VMKDGWLFLHACWRGWRMLRFPDLAPWSTRPAQAADPIEIGEQMRERIA